MKEKSDKSVEFKCLLLYTIYRESRIDLISYATIEHKLGKSAKEYLTCVYTLLGLFITHVVVTLRLYLCMTFSRYRYSIDPHKIIDETEFFVCILKFVAQLKPSLCLWSTIISEIDLSMCCFQFKLIIYMTYVIFYMPTLHSVFSLFSFCAQNIIYWIL